MPSQKSTHELPMIGQKPAGQIEHLDAIAAARDEARVEFFAFADGFQRGLEGFLFRIGDLRGHGGLAGGKPSTITATRASGVGEDEADRRHDQAGLQTPRPSWTPAGSMQHEPVGPIRQG
mgnify:CR=1 FL=1